MDRAQRLAIAQQISDQLQHHYQDQVKAIGIFGSVAREMDGPYSDIELYCVLQGENIETAYEWATETWKGLVNVYSQDIMLRDAAIIDETWPFVQSGYVYIRPLYDPDNFFPSIREIALKPRPHEFDQAVQNLIVGDLYELVGKIRNAHASGSTSAFSMLAFELTKSGASLIGLANQHLYQSYAKMLAESLELDNRPAGYDALCKSVISGKLEDPSKIANRADRFWEGIESWATRNKIQIYATLDEHLKKRPTTKA
jgi:kanamycin nucleotidyltransferase